MGFYEGINPDVSSDSDETAMDEPVRRSRRADAGGIRPVGGGGGQFGPSILAGNDVGMGDTNLEAG